MKKLEYKFLIIFIFISSTFMGCFEFDCVTNVLDRQINESNYCQALVTSFDCGATTSDSHGLIFINNLDTLQNGIKNPYVTGSDLHSLKIKWLSKDTLLVQGANTLNNWKMPLSYKIPKTKKTIHIVYK